MSERLPSTTNREAVRAFLRDGYLVLATAPSPAMVRDLLDALDGGPPARRSHRPRRAIPPPGSLQPN